MRPDIDRKTYNDISKRILSVFAAEKEKENVVLSPVSILLLLGLNADGRLFLYDINDC